MFNQLSDRLRQSLKRVRGQARLTEDNIKQILREVRVALLEADVALPVVKTFIEGVRQRAVGREVIGSLSPGQTLVKVVHEELVTVLGRTETVINLAARPPVVILVAGLQGAGKTTSVAKLACWIKQREKKKVMVTSVDVYRPAAIEQLRTLAANEELEFFPSDAQQSPMDIAAAALDQARRGGMDVLIVDTAGRLHVDAAMMAEVTALHGALDPVETLFVADSMTGQDAVNSAAAFNDALPLTGVVLTKTDGDARGGAALSIRHVTGQPIKFIGTGEQINAFEVFHPDRLASRILGMGDVLSLVEQVEESVDQQQAEKLARKISRGKGFTLEDFRDQIQQMEKMGGIRSLMEKLPGVGELPANVVNQVDDGQMRRTIAIIDSMTPHERRYPAVIKGSRKRRIAAGSGSQIQEVNRLLKQFTQMQKTMKRMRKKGGMAQIMGAMKGRMPGNPF